jgi:hypothetical protein
MGSTTHGIQPGIVTPEDDTKRLKNIIAQIALAGHQVHQLEQGFLVCRWGQSKVCPDLASLATFARQLGGSQ